LENKNKMDSTTTTTLDLIKASQANPLLNDRISKAFTTSTGLTFYDLQAPAKLLAPVFSKLRNRIPRVPGRGDVATRWKSILSYNSTNVGAGVTEGNRGGIISDVVIDNLATYKTIGLENALSFESELAARGLDDARARAAQSLLLSMFKAEEKIMLGGNASTSLGAPTAPVLAAVAGTSTLAAATYSVIAVPLTFDGYSRANVTTGVKQTYTQTSAGPYSNADVHNGGVGLASPASTQAISGATQVLTGSTTPILGAAGFAWYVGLAGAEKLNLITSGATATITAPSLTGGQLASSLVATDYSADSLVYDGIYGIVMKNASSYKDVLANGEKLQSDGAGGIVQINEMFFEMYSQSQLGPDVLWVSATDMETITNLIIGNGGAPLIRFVESTDGSHGNIVGGARAKALFNKFTQQLVTLEVHPYLQQGIILGELTTLPAEAYAYSNVGSPLEVHVQQDYYQIDWPVITRKWEMGTYMTGTMACYVPFGFSAITNITPGV
jgi:hypothetical protein